MTSCLERKTKCVSLQTNHCNEIIANFFIEFCLRLLIDNSKHLSIVNGDFNAFTVKSEIENGYLRHKLPRTFF